MQEIRSPRNQIARVAGLLRNKREGMRPAGFFIAVRSDESDNTQRPFASGFSHIDGGFVIRLDDEAHAQLIKSGKVSVTVDDRFGRRVAEAGPFSLEDAQAGVAIDLDVPAEEHRLTAKPFWEPFEALRLPYSREIGVLEAAGVGDWNRFENSDIEVLSHKLDIPAYRLAALKLHGEMNTASPAFDAEAAKMLVEVGVRSRSELAKLEPAALLRTVTRAAEQGRIELGNFQRAYAGNWIMLARGWGSTELFHSYEPGQIDNAERSIQQALENIRPRYSAVAQVIQPYYWAQMNTVAQMRAILTAAGVYDLSALAPFQIRGRTLIGPGYHFRPALRNVHLLDDLKFVDAIVAHGGGFAKVKSVNWHNYGMAIVPNPVTDAVLLGPIVQFLDNQAQLVIGKDVTNLIMVTDNIDYQEVHKIVYEEPDRRPPTPAPFPSRPDLPSNPANVTSAYRPGSEDRKGRDGLSGFDGMDGREGFPNVDNAPSIKVYVKSTPNGLPDIVMTGRPGGIGQDGQDGGPGEDGAKGRESVGSFWLFCVTNVGHGGDGGAGGNGGKGGPGGQGGKGGSIEIYTPIENNIWSRPKVVLSTVGGPGGSGGQGGQGGHGGTGGEAGHDTDGCDAHPEWHGTNAADGTRGGMGDDGPKGADGGFSMVPITLDQWNAAFNYPYLLHLDPASGPPGTKVKAVGLNMTKFSTLYFGGAVISGAIFDAETSTVSFTVPDNVSGGPTTVTVELNLLGPAPPGLDSTMSNSLNFRVTPLIESINPVSGVPGQTLIIKGKGFMIPGAQIMFSSSGSPNTKVFPIDSAAYSISDLSCTLPFLEDIGLAAGSWDVKVQNPDGALSNAMPFMLSLTYNVRMRAWRVYPGAVMAGGGGGGSFGTDREVSEIQDILVNDENSPVGVWAKNGIMLTLGPVADAVLPAPWGDDSVPEGTDPIPIITTSAQSDGSFPFDSGAINIYFIKDIDDWTTHAYTMHKVDSTMLVTPPTVVFEDTASLSTAKAAIVAAHEVGHALGLNHVCARNDGPEVPTTLFGRVCGTWPSASKETTDREYLMFPELDWLNHNGVTVTSEEAVHARRGASRLHGK
jgi:hypothetical protein